MEEEDTGGTTGTPPDLQPVSCDQPQNGLLQGHPDAPAALPSGSAALPRASGPTTTLQSPTDSTSDTDRPPASPPPGPQTLSPPSPATPPPPGLPLTGTEISAWGKTAAAVTRAGVDQRCATATPGGGPFVFTGGEGNSCQANPCSSSGENGVSQGHQTTNKRRASPTPPAERKARKTGQDTFQTAADSDMEDDPAPSRNEPRPPPILLDMPRSWPAHAVAIGQLVGGQFDASCTGKNLRIRVDTVPHFRAVQRYLQQERVPFHTFALRTERLLKVVVKGLPPTLAPDEIMAEFHDFDISEVKMMKTRRGMPTGLWLLTIRRTEGYSLPSTVYEIRRAFYCKVDVRQYKRPNGPIQCHRCQGFGHGSGQCHRQVRCVRCGDTHPATECPKEPAAQAKCCNCGEAHTANYRGCTCYKTLQRASYAAAAKSSTAPSGRQPRRVDPPAPRPDPVDDEAPGAPEVDDEGFRTQRRRRRRAPRNPDNRGRASGPRPRTPTPPVERSAAPAGTPNPRVRRTPRPRLEVPPRQPSGPARQPSSPAPQPSSPAPQPSSPAPQPSRPAQPIEPASTPAQSSKSPSQQSELAQLISTLRSMLVVVERLVDQLTQHHA
ncbi:uncharacterized protein Rv2082-like [Macrosteles quadrilineatus]|uniref:uncharacterized protein Rv2082-like n=1 Tax=Macrosteles quadrilineatus TaxID=74068 RepID=UPI0023E0A453|nr:uncharacterized protein Rv2082-like [Macrosteles quadrilineatus]